jgi:rare lipoprotein A
MRRHFRTVTPKETADMFKPFNRLWVIGFLAVFPPLIVQAASVGDTETGVAAYYSKVFQGRRTASGERYDGEAYTAAHNRLPFGTRLRVTNLGNGKRVELTVNDRGPSTPGRIIDVSRRAAGDLGFLREGLTNVQLEVISLPEGR